MKTFTFTLGVFFVAISVLLIQTANSHAVMVHYFDENGKIRYVNTAVTSVPERYMDQVRPQLEAAEQAKTEHQTPPMTPVEDFSGSDEQSATSPKIILDVLMTPNCRGCMRLFSQLRANNIFFRSHNVTVTPRGKELYQRYSGMPLPITIVGDQAVSGPDILKIKELLRQMENND